MAVKSRRRKPLVTALNAIGIFLLVAVILICLPLTLPKAFHYHIYTVVSGSMEPAIPVGSLVYLKEMPAEDVVEGDIIAFYGARDEASIITHRVVENRVLMGEFVTKGDANQTEDMNPIPYGNFIGRVAVSIPMVGGIAQALTSLFGKIAAASIVALSLLLQALAAYLDRRNYTRERN